MDRNVLQIIQRGGNEDMAKAATRIARVREGGHQMLCTLLVGNVCVNALLTIMVGEVMSSTVGFATSAALILFMGELLPHMVCSKRSVLMVGSLSVPVAQVLMAIFYVFVKPIAFVLDHCVGKEVGNVHTRQELIEMLKLQIALGAGTTDDGVVASQVAEGAFSFRDKMVADVMKPVEDTYMLPLDLTLSYDVIRGIFEKGYSRIPVYGKDCHDIIGLLYAKDLMLVDPEDEMKLGDFIGVFGRKVESFFKTTKLPEVLNRFKKGGTHMGLVREPNFADPTAPKVEVIGLLTLEDLVEVILQDDIVDETDAREHADSEEDIRQRMNLGLFNPNWSGSRSRLLTGDEISAVASHLERSVFMRGGPLELSFDAVRWLVAHSEVQELNRQTPLGTTVPVPADYLCRAGYATKRCFLVLKGRVSARLGRDSLICQSGAFSVLARDALRPSTRQYAPDFTAYLSTPKVRLLVLTQQTYLRAKELDKDKAKLDEAITCMMAEARGELTIKELERRERISQGDSSASPSVIGFEDSTSPRSPAKREPLHKHWQQRGDVTAAELGCQGTFVRMSSASFPQRMSV
eukprot:TRINITY_DN39140_c0_g1_i1.p1 TRINITY_DN39140_c0_g1~~TRINITY_DN39140_c0_g1_i1.p1  ORF type:complete len:675 (-),score=132.97 TRINITY_DN39140_c0_g1_i1:82-1809(-)